MNKENRNPHHFILKRRDAQLSSSRSIPSIFRRKKKRARPDHPQHPIDHHSHPLNLHRSKPFSVLPNLQKCSSNKVLTQSDRSHQLQQSKFDKIETGLVPAQKTTESRVTNRIEGKHDLNHEADLKHAVSTTEQKGTEREMDSHHHKNFAKCHNKEEVNASSHTATTQQQATTNNHHVVRNSQVLEDELAKVETYLPTNADDPSTSSLRNL